VEIENMRSRNLRTGPHTPPAQNATIVIDDHVLAGHIRWKGIEGERHREVIHSQFIGQRLKLTVSALGAEHAIVVSFSKEELQDRSPAFKDPFTGGDHLHAFSDRQDTTGRKLGRPIHLHDTHPAPSPVRKSRVMAQGGDVNVIPLSSFQNGDSILDQQFFPIHGYFYCFLFCFHIPSLSLQGCLNT
jgi:hypothetical protein